jgi:hypothetical protein
LNGGHGCKGGHAAQILEVGLHPYGRQGIVRSRQGLAHHQNPIETTRRESAIGNFDFQVRRDQADTLPVRPALAFHIVIAEGDIDHIRPLTLAKLVGEGEDRVPTNMAAFARRDINTVVVHIAFATAPPTGQDGAGEVLDIRHVGHAGEVIAR